MRILIIGGYGSFGGRLVDLLLDEPRLTLIVGGRSLEAAQRFCAARHGAAVLEPVRFDREAPESALVQLKPDIAVDCAGPFQLYGRDPYRVIRAALAAGAHWIDLADGLGFVRGIGELDAVARAAGKFVLTGTSTCPVLTTAVVRRLGEGMTVKSVIAGIAPSPFAGLGLSVVKAIMSYAGSPVRVLENGEWTVEPGLISSRTMTVSVPGKVPLLPTRFALVEVPDLEVVPEEWPEVESVWFGAGPRPPATHRILWLLAGLVRVRLLPSLLPLARFLDWAADHIRWGEDRGGMIVEVSDGQRTRSWHMLAEGNSGPYVPSMAAEAIIRKCLDGAWPEAGARSAQHEVELSDYDAMFARRGIVSGIREDRDGTPYQRVLGSAYAELPKPVQDLHAFETTAAFSGRARVAGASNPVGKLVARIFGFPRPADDIAVTVTLAREDGVETWTRSFAGSTFQSKQQEGEGRYAGLIVERFGLTGFGMAVVVEGCRLGLVLRRWDILGLPMPRWLMPHVTAGEHADDGRFHFLVDIALPVLGRLVRYEGWLLQDKSRA